MPLKIDRRATNTNTRNKREKASCTAGIALNNQYNKSFKKGIRPTIKMKIGVQPIAPDMTNVLATNVETLSSPL